MTNFTEPTAETDERLRAVRAANGRVAGHIKISDGSGHFMAIGLDHISLGRFSSRESAIAAVLDRYAVVRAQRAWRTRR